VPDLRQEKGASSTPTNSVSRTSSTGIASRPVTSKFITEEESAAMRVPELRHSLSLQVDRVKERLAEWEVERFASLCMTMKKTLLDKSRDPNTASLATIPEISSVANLRASRQQQQLAGQAEEKAGLEPTWTIHTLIENECLRASWPCYQTDTIKPILMQFLKEHLDSLSQTQMILLMRTHLATDKTDYTAWNQEVGPQV